MIIKSYEIEKINLDYNQFILFYGKNDGLKNDAIKKLIKEKGTISNYDEKEILDNQHYFFEDILTKSLFEDKKTIIIRRASDKLLKIIEEIASKNIIGISIIINSEQLEKKSKLRSFFEKNKSFICVAFYPDTNQTLAKLTFDFFKKKKISVSSENINVIVNRCNGDRETLFKELEKIEYYSKNKENITSEDIGKLTNLIENHSISELIDNCLVKNKKKIIYILNENKFNNEDCILITRTFLNKSKKILKLSSEFSENKNIDLTISSAKPPIFWKDKEITKQQIYKWSPRNIKKLIYKLTDIELQLKRNINNSLNILTDFILDQSSSDASN